MILSNILRSETLLNDVLSEINSALNNASQPDIENQIDLPLIQSSLQTLNQTYHALQNPLLQLTSACTLLSTKLSAKNSPPQNNYLPVIFSEEMEREIMEFEDVTKNSPDKNMVNVVDTPGKGLNDEEGGGDDSLKKKEGISGWDMEFMELRALVPGNQEKSLLDKCQRMADLSDSFFAAATTFARMIVAEQHCQPEEKKIRPLDVSGIAGGTKFGVHGLFFKYPVDNCIDQKNHQWLYGGNVCDDNSAAKASNHDLNGQIYFMMADESLNFKFPLSGLIDYQGFRLTVMTSLPVSSKTLVYGSDDGGHTIHADPTVHEKMKLIGEKLNLKKHHVSEIKPTEMALCGDIEIHKLTNNKDEDVFYALDLARVFPPAAPEAGYPPGSIFFRMLRPELIKGHKVALSSDALSNWQSDPESHLMNVAIVDATKILIKEVENFAQEICDGKMNAKYIQTAFSEARHPSFNGIPTKDAIIRDLHRRGINTRYLGYLVISMNGQNQEMINFLISLMATRAMKNFWRKHIRIAKGKKERIHEICLKNTEHLISSVLLLFNQDPPKKKKIWNKLTKMMVKMFEKGIIPKSKQGQLLPIFEDATNRKTISIWWVVIRFCELCGIVLSPACLQCLVGSISFRFSRADILGFIPLLKFSPILEYYTGLNNLLKARKEEKFGSRLVLTKSAARRLVNAINYDFPDVRELYAEAQFETIKFDRTFIGDWDEIVEQYKMKWQKGDSTLKVTKEFLDYLHTLLWKLFVQPLPEEEIKDDNISINLSKNTLVSTLWDILYGSKKEEITYVIKRYQKTLSMIDSQFIELKKESENYNSLSPFSLLKDLDPGLCIKLLEESKDWDIDKEKKWWFFAKYFSLPDLVKFCHQNNLKNLITQEEFLLSPCPHIITVFYYGHPDLGQALDDLMVPHKDQFDLVLKKTYENGKSLLNSAIEKKASDVVDYLISRGGLQYMIKQAISCTSEVEVINSIKRYQICNVQLTKLNLTTTDKDVPIADYASLIGVTIIASPNLKELIINPSHKHHQMGPTVVNSIVMLSALNSSSLTLLYLTNNDIGTEGAVTLAAYLHSNSTLTSLSLKANTIGDEGAIALATALQSNSTLSSLNVCRNKIGLKGAIAIANTLYSNVTLTSLHIGCNEIGKEGALAFTTLLNSNKTLSSLSLYGNEIGEEAAVALAQVLSFNSSLSSLDIHKNSIGNRGIIAIAQVLNKSYLSALNVSDNGFDEEGAIALATALQTNTRLLSLNVHKNGFADKGTTALATALSSNTTLLSLNLNDNKIGTEGGIALANALLSNSTLTSLTLSWNRIGDKGAISLGTGLSSNLTLSSIDINTNGIYNEGAKALATALQSNTTLTSLNIKGNHIYHLLEDAINAIVAFNSKNKAGTDIDIEQRKTLVANLIDKSSLAALQAPLMHSSEGSTTYQGISPAFPQMRFVPPPSFMRMSISTSDSLINK